ncbi:MAG: ATP-binding protein [Gammaproteobacteria bacterium]|nr:ATP-binding protein [Gammaproteobacteria bacterium]
MSREPDATSDTTHRNLRRLFLFRSISLGLQMLMIFIALRWLALPLPVLPLAAIFILHALWNGFTAWRAQQQRPVTETEFFLQLLTDVLALSGVLYLTGGATNPFVGFYLLPLMIAATVLRKPFVWSMAGITVTCYSLLVFVYIPLDPGSHMQHDASFNQHVFGMWFGFVFSAGLVSFFVTNMAQTLRQRDRVLAAAREQALRSEHLVALGTLAAGAAHELSTPLNTMAIITDELKDDYPPHKNADLHAQLSLIGEQIQRCKAALSVISASAGEQRAEAGEALAVDIYLDNLLIQWQAQRPRVISLQQSLHGVQPAPRIIADRALDQAILNVLNNAADASPDWVAVSAEWTEQRLRLAIEDRGPGLDAEARALIGKRLYSSKPDGLGLGLYLAHSAIERLGGTIEYGELPEGRGTCTRIGLPLLERATP